MGWFILGFLAPILALILVLVLPDLRVQQERERKLRSENRRLRERVRKDRQVADQRYVEHQGRLAVHDEGLGVDTSMRAPPSDEGSTSLPPPVPAHPVSGVQAAQWYYVSGEERQGPISHETLRGFLEMGVVSAETFVWTESMEDWMRLNEHRALWESLRG